MKIAFFLSLMLSSSLCLAKTCSDIESRTAAHDFYTKIQEHRLFGVPTAAELESIRPYMTRSLHALFAAATQAEEKELQRSGGNEPPLFGGHLFSAQADGYTNFHIANATTDTQGAQVKVLLQYAQHLLPYYANTPGIMEWSARVEIRPEGDTCLVNDLLHAADNDDERLSKVLAEIAAASQ